ncbi:MAG: 8-oxo-dGTP diphosphatase MutT [Alphaproteobacteria bacterium]
MNKCLEALEQPRPLQEQNLPVMLVAAAALINKDGRVLIAQRSEGKTMAGLWEFPGGKVHEGETPEFALMRELEEELGIETRPGCFMPIAFASHSYESFHLLMPLFVCRTWKGQPQAREHSHLKWVKPQDLYDYPMPPADMPLISTLRDLL